MKEKHLLSDFTIQKKGNHYEALLDGESYAEGETEREVEETLKEILETEN